MIRVDDKILFLVNRSAGGRRCGTLQRLLEAIPTRYARAEIRVYDALKAPVFSPADYDCVVVCGGDGSVQAVAARMQGTQVPLGIVPLGSGNDLIKTLGLPSDPVQALEALGAAGTRAMDVVRFSTGRSEPAQEQNRGIMVNTLGLGLDGLASYETRRYRAFGGRLMYWLAVLRAARRQPRFTAQVTTEHRSGVMELWMLTLANGSTEGGHFRVAPQSVPWDGLIHVTAIRAMPRTALLLYLPWFISGRQERLRRVVMFRCRCLTVQSSRPVRAHADGEDLGELSCLSANLQVGALHVLG